jgi:hypothetical protein
VGYLTLQHYSRMPMVISLALFVLPVIVAYKFPTLYHHNSILNNQVGHVARKSLAGRKMNLNMNMFDRMVRVVTSNVNNVLKQLEDPEK